MQLATYARHPSTNFLRCPYPQTRSGGRASPEGIRSLRGGTHQRPDVVGDLGEGHDARGVIGSAARIQRSEQTEPLEALALITGWRVHVRMVAPGADKRLSAHR